MKFTILLLFVIITSPVILAGMLAAILWSALEVGWYFAKDYIEKLVDSFVFKS
jgi:hypothetical protein